MEHLVSLLKAKGYTIASCESLTGGLFCSKLAEISGVSAVLKGGLVTYWSQIKTAVAHVSPETISQYGVVSWQTAREMAINTQQIFQSDVAVSFTGNAGPDTLEGKPKGLVYTCICINDKVYDYEDLIDLPRNRLREEIVRRTADRLSEQLERNECGGSGNGREE